MTLSQVKQKLYERVIAYWGNATVVWGSTNKVKPNSPLVVLSVGTVTRPKQPITLFVEGVPVAAYPTETTLTVDLSTRGKKAAPNDTPGGYYENTAENDLLRFVNYFDSPATVDWCARNDISLYQLNGVLDLSQVINDTQWAYRAMVEFAVSFTDWTAEAEAVLGDERLVYDADGNLIQDGAVKFDENGKPIGIDRGNWEQTASGGGTKELADEITGFFTEAETREVNRNGK